MQQIFNGLCVGMLLVQVIWVWFYGRKRRKEILLLRQQERFLGETAVNYTKSSDLKEAILDSIRPQDALMTAEGNQLVDSLEKSTAKEVMDYLSRAGNSFFSIFYAMCHTVRDLGDIKKGGQSLFVHNIQYIEEEVRMEILRIQNASYRFSGLLGLCAAPFFLMPVLRDWALSIESGMKEFYDGSYGMATTLVCFAVTAVELFLILWLHYPDLKPVRKYRLERKLLKNRVIAFFVDKRISRRYSEYLKKNEELKKLQGFGNIRQFLMRRLLCGCFCAVAMVIGIVVVKETGRIQLRQEFAVPSVWTVELSEPAKEELEQHLKAEFEQMLRQNVDSPWMDDTEWAAYSYQVRKACKVLLEQQKQAYDKIRVYWYDLLLLILAGALGSAIPEIELALCRWNVEQKKMEETLRFETMILVLMHYPEMTVEDILKWLESFAELFRQALERAVDSFSYDRKQALAQLKEDVAYEPVGRIADALDNCDEVKISEAFLNMEAERNYYMDQYKQKVNAWTRERAALAKLTAYLPFILVMMFKLIIPFVAQGLGELSMYNEGMTTLM